MESSLSKNIRNTRAAPLYLVFGPLVIFTISNVVC